MAYKPVQRPLNEITWENKAEKLPKIRVGDKVWVGEGDSPCTHGIREVTRLTDTLIITDKGKERWERFKRDTGYQVGQRMFAWHITGVATKAEVEAYEAKQQAEKARQTRIYDEAKRIEALQIELNTLFGDDDPIYVRSEELKDDGKFTVTISGLTEEQVRDLAPKLKKAVAGK